MDETNSRSLQSAQCSRIASVARRRNASSESGLEATPTTARSRGRRFARDRLKSDGISLRRVRSPEAPKIASVQASAVDGKVQLAAGLTADLIALGLHAGQWLKDVAPIVGGGGGGRPDLAQAGGKNPEQIPAALARALEFVESKLRA